MDTSKRIFLLHGVNEAEQPVLRRKLSRVAMIAFFQRLEPAIVAMEACGASHYWARELKRMGHEVRLMAPQLVKPYVKRGKNDAADAEALCEAASRPTMRFVPVKTADRQAGLMLAGARERLVRQLTQLANAIRGHAAEFGITVAKGRSHIPELLAAIGLGKPCLDVSQVRLQARKYAARQGRDRCIGFDASPDPHAFRSGRDFAAWLGLTPKDHSTAGKTRLGRITRAGDETLRSLLVVGATAVIWQTRRGASARDDPWLAGLLRRKPPKLAAVALANKMARIAWKLLTSGEDYNPAHACLAKAA